MKEREREREREGERCIDRKEPLNQRKQKQAAHSHSYTEQFDLLLLPQGAGSLTCVALPTFSFSTCTIIYTHWTAAYTFIRTSFTESARNWTPEKCHGGCQASTCRNGDHAGSCLTWRHRALSSIHVLASNIIVPVAVNGVTPATSYKIPRTLDTTDSHRNVRVTK